jgi:predicted DNA-binding transcriptional regulator
LTFVLFNVLVSSSILAGMSPIVFYSSITLMVGTLMRPILIFGTWKGFVYEVTSPETIIKLVEKCYLARHEENLVEEEEAYRML